MAQKPRKGGIRQRTVEWKPVPPIMVAEWFIGKKQMPVDAQLSFRGTETDRVSSFSGFPHRLHSLPVRFQRSFKGEQVAHVARIYIRSVFEIIFPSSGLVERVARTRKLWLHPWGQDDSEQHRQNTKTEMWGHRR